MVLGIKLGLCPGLSLQSQTHRFIPRQQSWVAFQRWADGQRGVDRWTEGVQVNRGAWVDSSAMNGECRWVWTDGQRERAGRCVVKNEQDAGRYIGAQ